MTSEQQQAGLCRAVTYRLSPTVGQTARLGALLESQRVLYNAALEERVGAWKWEARPVTWVDQYKQLTGAAEQIPSLGVFGLQPHRGTLKRLDEAFAGFFRRVKAGLVPGFPRFRSKARWDSVTYPEAAGWKVVPIGTTGTYGRVRVTGVGHVKLRLAHGKRARTGTPAKCVIRRRGCGPRARWEVTVFYKHVTPRVAPDASCTAAGVDRGITVLAAVADTAGNETLVPNGRPLTQARSRLNAKQRQIARARRGSNRRARLVGEVAVLHRKVADTRRDVNHQLSRWLVDTYQTVVFEDLRVLNMVRRPAPRPDPETPGMYLANGARAKAGLNRSISDAGWGQLAQLVAYKAEEAGRRLVTVNPHHTSTTCRRCRLVDPRNRSGTVFRCLRCGHTAHADIHAAQNVLERGGFTTTTARVAPPRLTA